MSKSFEATVCAHFRSFLNAHGWTSCPACTFTKSGALGVFAMVWIVRGSSYLRGRFVPRLSIGLRSVGDDVAVLSADLVSLTRPPRREWYGWREVEDVEQNLSQGVEDLAAFGLPWLESHLDAKRLTEALEARAAARSRVDSNTLTHLSHAYEAQGEILKALEAWRRYRAGLDLLVEGSDADLRIAERERALVAKLSDR
jgi:hypothetical protein